MKTFLGTGQGNAADAVKQATSGLTSPQLIIFMSPYEMLGEVAAKLKEMYPDADSIGTIGTKLINGHVSDRNVAVLGLFNDVKSSCGVIQHISKCPVAYATEFKDKISKVGPGKDDTVCIEYCAGSEEKLVTTFTSFFERNGIKLVGGTVFGTPDGKPTLLAYNGNVYEDACVYAIIKNTTGKVRVYKENIYEKNSDKYHFATKVDVDKKSLIELDGRPAADVYSEELGVARNKIVDNVMVNPMGRVVGDEVFISSMNGLEPNGAINNYKRINKNDCIYFLNLGDYTEIERQTREQIKNENSKVSLVLSVDCIYRYLLYSDKGYFDTYAKDMATLGTHMGIVSGGEQCNNQHVNQTMVCAVFE